MAKVTMYTKDWCPYCVHAKNLLKEKGADFEEVNLEGNFDELAKLVEKTGMRTVPQIFIGDNLIGGFDELSALEKEGKLDDLLSS